MRADVKAEWTKELRSGRKQGTGRLTTVRVSEDGTRERADCCLGVLCDVTERMGLTHMQIREVAPRFDQPEVLQVYYDDEVALLPFAVMEAAELTQSHPIVSAPGYYPKIVGDEQDPDRLGLAQLNDNDVPFPKIAELIDAQL